MYKAEHFGSASGLEWLLNRLLAKENIISITHSDQYGGILVYWIEKVEKVETNEP
jgi:hypothetical protein